MRRAALPRPAQDHRDVLDRDDFDLGAELDANLALRWLSRRADRDAEQHTGQRARAEANVGEEPDLLDGAHDEREICVIALADAKPALATEAKAALADAGDQRAAGRDV